MSLPLQREEKTPAEPVNTCFVAGSGSQMPQTVPFQDQDPEMLQKIWARGLLENYS